MAPSGLTIRVLQVRRPACEISMCLEHARPIVRMQHALPYACRASGSPQIHAVYALESRAYEDHGPFPEFGNPERLRNVVRKLLELLLAFLECHFGVLAVADVLDDAEIIVTMRTCAPTDGRKCGMHPDA